MPSVPTSGSVPPPPPVWDARPPETTVRYAGFWIRVGAALVDGIALWIVWSIVLLVLPSETAAPLPEDPDLDTLVDYLNSLISPRQMIVYALIVWAYYAFQESSSAQATLGKRMLGIRVSTEDGGRLNPLMASLRAWPIYLPSVAAIAGSGFSTVVGLIALISCIAVAFSRRKQGLHDKMAGAILTRR
ncbi:MAG: RDD family protein [Rhodospirillales bacterium]|nr:RDD family protein [Rhodospirillales bacterium]